MPGAIVAVEDLDRLLAPRDGVILERLVERPPNEDGYGTYRFEQADGPLAAYLRTVDVSPTGDAGRVSVDQRVGFRVGVPYISWLFALPMRANLGALVPAGRSPWWAPPQRLPHTAAVTLASLCLLSAVGGYLGDLLPTAMTYAGANFGVGTGGQGIALGIVQVNAVLALGLLARSDRTGRRRLLLACTVVGAVLTAAGAASPSLVVLTVTQVAAASAVTAQEVLIGILAVEEMPEGARTWALALIAMCFGLGGGVALAALPVAGAGDGGWRWLFGFAIVAMPIVASCARHLPESARWQRDAQPSDGPRPRRAPMSVAQRRRLVLLGAAALLFALFDAPGGQLQNQYLRTQRHWSATRISLAEQITGTVGGVGTLVGGRLADTRGRRPVAVVAVGLGTVATLVQYFTHGPGLYVWMTAGSFLGYAVVPALSVYGAELFPSSLRGRAGGVLTILAAGGGLIGLGVTGVLAGAFGTIGPALAIMAVGPLVLIVLIVRFYPETAGRRLEDLNPVDDRAPTEPHEDGKLRP